MVFMSKKELKEEKRKFWDKYKEYYDTILLNCKLCKEFLEDGDFLEESEVPYGCGEINGKADFTKHCDYLKLSKWLVVSLFKKLTKRIKELERLVQIHETFMKNQYQYDKSLVMERFKKLEKRLDEFWVNKIVELTNKIEQFEKREGKND